MSILTLSLFALGFVLIGIAAFWNWGQVMNESIKDDRSERGIFYFFSQLYAIYYELVHRRSRPHVATIYGIFFLGCLCFVAAYLVGRNAGVLPP